MTQIGTFLGPPELRKNTKKMTVFSGPESDLSGGGLGPASKKREKRLLEAG
jgi:hypothetical protein